MSEYVSLLVWWCVWWLMDLYLLYVLWNVWSLLFMRMGNCIFEIWNIESWFCDKRCISGILLDYVG